MSDILYNLLEKSKLLTATSGHFNNVNHAYIELILSLRYKKNNKNLIIVLPNLYDAQKFYDAMSSILGDEDVLFYPADQVLTSMMALGSPEFKNERLYTLRKLIDQNKKYIIITTQEGLLKRQLTPKDYINSVVTLKTGDTIEIEELSKKLVYDGFTFNYTVERPGEFSVRGSIVDIFTHNNKDPYRLDFFGDEIETIKTFDVLTQRSISKESSIDLSPLNELFFTDRQKTQAIEDIKAYFSTLTLSEKEEAKFRTDLEYLDTRKRMDGLHIYIEFFNEEKTTILDFLGNYELVCVDPFKIEINEETIHSDLLTYAETMMGDNFLKLGFRLPYEEVKNKVNLFLDIYQSTNVFSTSLGIMESEPFLGELNQLLIYLLQYPTYDKFIAVRSLVNKEKVKAFLEAQKIDYQTTSYQQGGIHIVDADLPGSFVDTVEKILVLTEDTIFSIKHKTKIRYRSVINQAVKIRDSSELEVGDYVVHYDFGIGQYMGLKTMSLSGEKRDYLHIVYEANEALYVPTDQIDLVLKYRSHEGVAPKLSKLGAKQWSKTKASVRKKIKDLSDRLLKLYATRNSAEGFQYSPDSEMMENFERDFVWEETLDQKLAIDAVKKDMENVRPMDRLIAGDVGFGKTEVALRAAFKAVLDGKQVAYLVPTTVLARQHYYTFKERFEKYGATVSLMSRFVSAKEQKETLEKLSRGHVDVIIGTHRILSEDIKFKDLGLFIIDEEQRFGVEHKEKIKELKVNVDTLTLSATPIPRTLQMAMYGLKDLSMIETPPLNRYPVQTYVVERQDALVKEAIDRELSRGGQVFYLYNRVETIENVVAKIQKLVPNARIAFAHGKMNKNKLEEVLTDFIEKTYDVLVSTTIIETGVDIPNTNTLIIHDADKLGLAQLYQLRGRVGRSDRIAYAYLMFDAYKNINDEARKRLSVIEDFTDLGSGFKIALRDLSIRGAGDLLGDEQSGFIDSVGIELYMKLLDEVMQGKLEDEPKVQLQDQVFASRHIPQEYINSDPVRIEIHKRIATLNSTHEVEELRNELSDRFGEIDVDVLTYMYEKLFKKLGFKLGIEKTAVTKESVKFTLSLEKSQEVDGLALLEAGSLVKTKMSFGTLRGHVEINMITKGHNEHWLYLACLFVEKYFQLKNK